MTSYDGSDTLLQIGDGESPAESLLTLGALRRIRVQLRREMHRADQAEGDGWARGQETGGIRSLTLLAEGVYRDDGAQARVRECAFGGEACLISLTYPSGSNLTGSFHLRHYADEMTADGEVTFSMELVSQSSLSYSA